MGIVLDQLQKTAVGILMESGVVGGEELMAKTKKTDSELYNALTKLISDGLVHSNTVLYAPEVVPGAYFNLKPSALGLAKDLISG